MLLAPSVVMASENKDVQITVTIDELFDMVLDTDGISWIKENGTDPTANDYNDPYCFFHDEGYGWTNPEYNVKATIKTNAGWSLWLMGTSEYFTGEGPYATDVKPCSDIVWQDSNPLVWNHLTMGGFPEPERPYGIGTFGPYGEWAYGSPNAIPGGTLRSVDFRVLLKWENDPAGDYTYQYICFTLASD